MTYQQVRDVVARIRTTHQQLRDALEGTEAETSDPRAQLMEKWLSQEEEQLQLTLAQYGVEGEKELLDTWLQYVPDEEVLDKLKSLEFRPNLPAEDLVARKMEFDQAMMAFLKQLADETSVPRVEEFFRTLLENAESRAASQAWSMREFQGDAEPPNPKK